MFFSLISLALLGFADFSIGAPAAITNLEKGAARTSAPSGCINVKAGTTTSGWYKTVSSAIASLSGTSNACIFVYSGTYNEQVVVGYGGALTIYGYTTDTGSYKSNTVTITHTLSSPAAGSLDASSTVLVKSANFNMYNINVANGYGKGAQAVALTANGNQQGYYGCKFDGFQDTLFAKSGSQYYSNCYIAGAVDYIFGDASAWFAECTIASKAGGAITASSRESASDTAWYVFDHSTVTADAGFSLSQVVYLGRPWRVLARVIYQNSVLTGVVAPKGWTEMAENATPIYMEYNNSGDGANTSKRSYLTATKSAVSKSTLWPNGYAWIDNSY